MDEAETYECQRCGVRSGYRDGYVAWKSVIHGPVKLCAPCNDFKRRYGWFYLACVQNALILTVVSYGMTKSWPAAAVMAGCVYA